MSLRKLTKGMGTEAIRSLKKEEMNVPIKQEDFEEAFSKIQSSVSSSDLSAYERWMKEFGSA